MRNTFLKTLLEEAKKDERIWCVTADVGFSVLEPFSEKFPDRFLNVGIAEQNAVGIAAGLALNGKIPYVYSIIPFAVSRPYEQIKVDVAYMNTNVRIVGIGAGFSYGSAGATHHALDDIAIMRALPDMAVCCPGSLNETEALVRYSVRHRGAMYLRLGKSGEPRYDYHVEFGKFSTVVDGTDFAIITTGTILESGYALTEQYHKEGKSPLLLSAHTIKPLDTLKINELINSGMPIVTMEEHNLIGGLASAVSEVIAVSGKSVKFLPIGVPDTFSHFVGDRNFIADQTGIGTERSKQRIDAFLKECR